MKKICILGLGYIGLPTAAMFATHGHKIIGVDINENLVNEINKGNTIILVTHEEYIAEHENRIIRLGEGKIKKDEALRNRRVAEPQKF